MTAPRAREQSDPPAPPDRRPPRRGGGSSPSTYASSAGGGLRGLLRPARRTALAAAGLAGLVLAAGLALAPPAQAQSTTEIWSATMTPAVITTGTIGYSHPGQEGTLSDRTFSHAGTDYAISETFTQPVGTGRRLHFVLNKTIQPAALSDLTLVVDSDEFVLANGTIAPSGISVSWYVSVLSWSAGTDVSLSLKAITGRPTTSASSVNPAGNTLRVNFNENLSNILPPTSAFTLTAAGSPVTIGSISLQTSLRALDLTDLSPLIGAGQTVTLDYTDPSTGDDTNAIQDTGGTDAHSFSRVVFNQSAVTLPKPTAAAVPADGATVVLTFSETLLAFQPAYSSAIRNAFTVTVDGTESQTTDFAVSGATATLTMSDTIEGGQTVVVGYDRSDAGSEALGTGEVLVANFTTGENSVPAVVNNSTAGPARLASAAVDAAGTQLTLTFNKSLNAETGFPAWFTVTADGADVRINGFQGLSNAGDSFVIRFSAGSPIYKDETVVVVYERPADSDGLTDEANDVPVASFTTGLDGVPAVTNAATALAPPKPDTAASASKVGTGGSGLVLAFDGPLTTDNAPPASAFSITAGGVAIGIGTVLLSSNMTEGAVSLAGLTPKVRQGETVELTYTDPTSADDTNALQGTTGTDVHSFTVTLTNASTVTTGPPRPPTGLTATALGATIVDLAWTAPADDGDSAITGYKVEVSNTGSSGWTDLAADTGDANAWYRQTGLSNGDTRHYRVSAINANGTSPASASANATTMIGTPHTVPGTIYGTPLWSATLTVGTLSNFEGYIPHGPLNSSTPQGALSPNSFDLYGTIVEVEAIRHRGTSFRLQLSAGLGDGNGYFNLHLGGTTAQYDNPRADLLDPRASVFHPVPNWQHGDRVDVRLVEATAPAKPTEFSATAAGNAQIDLAWTAPADDGGRAVSGYKIEVSDDGSTGSWTDLVADTASTDTAYSHTGLSAGDTRHYRVSAINAVGTSDESESDDATTQRTVPDPPEASAIADGTSKIVVSWSAPANDGGSAVTGYRLQVSPDGVSDWRTLVEDTTDTSHTHTGLSAGTTRHYRVYATNAQGTSQPSAVVSDMTQGAGNTCTVNTAAGDYWCGVVTVALHTEGGFDLAYGFVDTSVTTNTSDTGALSDETFPVGPNNYTIDVVTVGLDAVGGNLAFSLTSDLTAADKEKLVLHVGSRSFAFSDVTANTDFTYLWHLSGLDWSSSTSITLRLRRVPAAPGAPTNLMAEADGGTRIGLTWTAPVDNGGSAITGYRIEVSDDGSSGSWSELVADTGNADTSYTHTGLSPGDTRHYRVSAINATGTSEASDSDDATTADPPTLSSASVSIAGTIVNLVFSEGIDVQSEFLPTSVENAFTVTVDGAEFQIDSIRVGQVAREMHIDLQSKIYQGQTVTLSYDRTTAGTNALDDTDGNKVDSFADYAVVNNSTQTPPVATPTNFRAMAGDAQVTLSWDEPASDSGVTHHDYRFRTGGDYEDWIEIDDSGPGETNASGFTVTPLENGTEHTFELRAGGDDGDSLSADEVRVTPTGDAVPTIETVAVPSTPRLTSAGGTEPDTYGRGETIEFSVTFSEPVEVTGDPQFGFSLDGARVADYASGTGSETLVFVYSVRQDDVDDDGIWVGNHSSGTRTLQLDSDDAIAAAVGGADADLEHDRLNQLSGHKVDGSRVSEDVPEEPVRVTLHLSEADGEVPEDGGAVTVTARASRGAGSAFTVTVSAQPVAPATAGDFTLSANPVLRFAANATASTGTVTIAPVDDDVPEPRDAVRVSGAVSGADIADPEPVTLSIANDDDLEPFDVAVEGPAQVGESDGAAQVTVTLTTQGTDRPAFAAQLYYAVQPGTATRGEDWTAPSGTESGTLSVLFTTVPPGSFRANGDGNWEARRSFTLGIVNDAEREASEDIVFRVDTGSSRYQSAPHTIAILDDDGPPAAPEKPALSAVPGSFTELEADWDEPALDGAAAVTGYDLQYREGAGGTWTPWPHDDASTTARLTALAVETAYRVRVRALNRAEASGWSPDSDEVETGAYAISGICNRSPRVEDRIMVRLKYVHSFKGDCGM